MTTTLAEPGETVSLTGFRAMDYSDHPLAIVNPAATPSDGVAWAVEELSYLSFWLDLVACSKADNDVDPAALCGRITSKLEQVHDVLQRCIKAM